MSASPSTPDQEIVMPHGQQPTGPATRRAGSPRRPRRGAASAATAAAALALLLLPTGPAQASTSAAGPGEVTVRGEPLVHRFDLAVPGDAVTGWWEVAGSGAVPVPYEAVLLADGEVAPALAAALVVEYGRVGPDGGVDGWRPAGTLAEPRTYAEAVPEGVHAVAAGTAAAIPVRVSLPDPAAVTGEPGAELLVEASFTVRYLGAAAEPESAPAAPPAPPAGAADPAAAAPAEQPAALARTGLPAWVLPVAAALVAAGMALRRHARSRTPARAR